MRTSRRAVAGVAILIAAALIQSASAAPCKGAIKGKVSGKAKSPSKGTFKGSVCWDGSTTKATIDWTVSTFINYRYSTKSLVQALEKAGAPADKKTLLVVASADETLLRAAGNVERLRVNSAGALQVFDVLNADVIVLERAAIDKVQQLYAPKAE
ncbi:hypothetical protein Rsub_07664 [Raphidocelis subcapitata]|uniref:50S ribosomal protein L4 n=1 Tax=Raphidocelis subcapitata TaxID=307507 RepID=A0A2V0P4H2_9CHLO|nr:hypothetical protein Rsub_07664 [Raphidocelis subcapitata]|eukprot:GBF94781.1 hypothetical protein Rsub_07664 [Raphidocelis subcapitata]